MISQNKRHRGRWASSILAHDAAKTCLCFVNSSLPTSYHTIMYACPYDPLLQLLPTFHSVANWSKYYSFRSRIWLCKGSHPSRFCLIYLAATYIMTPTYIKISVRVFLNKYKKYSKLFEYIRVQVHDTYYYLPTSSSFSKQHSHLLATTSKSCTDVFEPHFERVNVNVSK